MIICYSDILTVRPKYVKRKKGLARRPRGAQKRVPPSASALARNLKISVIITASACSGLEREGFTASAQGRGGRVFPRNKETAKENSLKKQTSREIKQRRFGGRIFGRARGTWIAAQRNRTKYLSAMPRAPAAF
jgi:hypothetical protein